MSTRFGKAFVVVVVCEDAEGTVSGHDHVVQRLLFVCCSQPKCGGIGAY